MDMPASFDSLLANARAELRRVEADYQEHAARFDTAQVLRADQARQALQTFIVQAEALRAAWDAIPLQAHPQPVARVRRAAERVEPAPAPPAGQPPLEEDDFQVPILRALVNLGGRARTAIVIDAVGVLLQDRLGPQDFEAPGNNHEIRWRYYCRWARQTMVETGLLRDDSPHGIWEISEQGRAYLLAQAA